MEERNMPFEIPLNSIAANCSQQQPSHGISNAVGGYQIANHNKNCSVKKLKGMTGNDVSSNNGKVDSGYNQGRVSLTSIVSVETLSPTRRTIDLGHGSNLIYIQRFLPSQKSWTFFDYLNNHIPWTRPTIRVFGRSCIQPRDTCYVASSGLTALVYSGYQPQIYPWDDFPPLKEILHAINEALPGSRFNSLLLNRYQGASDYVGWHADDEKLYGPTPEIASVSFGCERDFLLKKKKIGESSSQEKTGDGGPVRKRLKREDQQSLTLKHGSLLVMRGYTQRDWIHSVPKRVKAEGTRINLTFRLVL